MLCKWVTRTHPICSSVNKQNPCLPSRLPLQLLADDSMSYDGLDEGAQRQLALVGQQQKVSVQ